MTPEPEVHHASHRTGHRWVDFAVPSLSLGVNLPTVLRAGDDTLILGLKREGQEALWDKLNTLRFELKFRACYCSVFDECWVSDLVTVSPQPVEQCPATEDSFTYLKSRKVSQRPSQSATSPAQ
ncbi:MAG TPA: hypothetical protein VH814_26515 [Steroidobacteraceae bacterium]|jgi:hypothetical protein